MMNNSYSTTSQSRNEPRNYHLPNQQHQNVAGYQDINYNFQFAQEHTSYRNQMGSHMGHQNHYNNSFNNQNMQYQNGYNLTRNTHSFGSYQKLTQYPNTTPFYGAPPNSTKLCDHWKKSGHCSFGDSCWYAHGEFDLRKTTYFNSPPRGKAVEENSKVKKESENKETVISTRLPPSGSVSVKGMGSKRASTNVKGLTVNIPTNITTKDDNGSMPLSPAQERWISMSNAEKAAKDLNSAKSDDTVTAASSTSTVVVGKEDEAVKLDSGQDTIFSKMDNHAEFPNARFPVHLQKYPYSTQTHANPMFMNRSYGRGPQSRPSMMTAFGQNSKMSRSSSVFSSPIGSFYPSQHSGVKGANLAENGGYGAGEKQMPPANTYSHLADEIYRRQKAMELEKNQLRHGYGGYQNSHEYRRRQQEEQELLKQFQVEKMVRAMATIDSHYEIPPWKYDSRRGMSVPPPNQASFQASRQAAMIMQQRIQQQQFQNQQFAQQQLQNQNQQAFAVPPPYLTKDQNQNQNHDCYCGMRNSSLPANDEHTQFDFDLATNPAGLAPPPRNFESLLPDDKAFSIWLDLKPRSENSSDWHPNLAPFQSGNVGIPSFETGNARNEFEDYSQKTLTENESVSPVLSLYDLLSSENLFDIGGNNGEKPVEKAFDFDFLEAVETNGTLTPTTSSHFYVDECKTPLFDEKKIGVSPPPLADNEKCYFFATGGTCPLGESCILTHEKEENEEEAGRI